MSTNIGTLVIAPVRPQDSTDTYPTAYANELLGGFQIYNVNQAGLTTSVIPVARRTQGMVVYSIPDNATYQLASNLATWNIYTASTPMIALGDTIYGGASGVETRLPGNTTTANAVLTQTGNGSTSSAPVWTSLGTGVLTAAGNAINTTNGILTLNGTYAAIDSEGNFVLETASGGGISGLGNYINLQPSQIGGTINIPGTATYTGNPTSPTTTSPVSSLVNMLSATPVIPSSRFSPLFKTYNKLNGLLYNGVGAAYQLKFVLVGDSMIDTSLSQLPVYLKSIWGDAGWGIGTTGVVGTGTTTFSSGSNPGIGTISYSSSTITGSGTFFVEQVAIGDTITASGFSAVVTLVNSETSLTVTSVSGTASGATFNVVKPQDFVTWINGNYANVPATGNGTVQFDYNTQFPILSDTFELAYINADPTWNGTFKLQYQLDPSTGPGTISLSGSTITGVGTSFLTTVAIGTIITTPGGLICTVTGITNNTSITVGTITGTASASTYTINGGWTDLPTSGGYTSNPMTVASTSTTGALIRGSMPAHAYYRLRLVALTGKIRVIGASLYDSTAYGGVPYNFAWPGTNLTQYTSCNTAITSPILTAIAQDITIYSNTDNYQTQTTLLPTFYSQLHASNGDWLAIGVNPMSSEGSGTDLYGNYSNDGNRQQNQAMLAFSLSVNGGFFDNYSHLINSAALVAGGLGRGDGVHLGVLGGALSLEKMADDLHLKSASPTTLLQPIYTMQRNNAFGGGGSYETTIVMPSVENGNVNGTYNGGFNIKLRKQNSFSFIFTDIENGSPIGGLMLGGYNPNPTTLPSNVWQFYGPSGSTFMNIDPASGMTVLGAGGGFPNRAVLETNAFGQPGARFNGYVGQSPDIFQIYSGTTKELWADNTGLLHTNLGVVDLTITNALVKANGSNQYVAAVAGTDYLAPVMTALGDTQYGGAAGALTRLAGNTTTVTKLFNQTGNGSISAAPAWSRPSAVVGLPRLGVDANVTALNASTGSYVGQLGMSQDGVVAIWNGSNWTADQIVFQNGINSEATSYFNIIQQNGNPAIQNFFTTSVIQPSGSSYVDNCLFIGNQTTNGGAIGTNGYAAVVWLDKYSGSNGFAALTAGGDSTLPIGGAGTYMGAIVLATSYPTIAANGNFVDNEYDVVLGDDIGQTGGATAGCHRMIELSFQDPNTVRTTCTTTINSTTMTVTGSTTGIVSGMRIYGPGITTAGTTTVSSITGPNIVLSANATQTTTSNHGGTGEYYVFSPAVSAPPRIGSLRPWNLTNLVPPACLQWTANGVAIGDGTNVPTFISGKRFSTPSLGVQIGSNSVQQALFKNTTNGTTAQMNVVVQSDNLNSIRLGATSSTGFTASGLFHAGMSYIEAQQCTDLTIKTDNDNPIIFGGNTTQWLKLTAAVASGILKVDGSNVLSVATAGVDYIAPGGPLITVVTGTSQAASTNNRYVTNNVSLVTVTLPATANVGDSVEVIGLGAGGWSVAQNASQVVHLNSTATTTGTGGSLASTNRYNTIKMTCVIANTTWIVTTVMGTITIT